MKNKTHIVVICGSDIERAERTKIIEAILMIKGVEVSYEVESEIDKDLPSLDDCFLSVQTFNLLKNEGIKTTSHLLSKSEVDLFRMPNLGKKRVNEIKFGLEKHGLKLRDHYLRW